ncbi:uncharacterized protein LOC135703686 [Ochlerotatus camptorhynchus]|uniref:uncharacterized protein LOC135703686 n=1 Tax=Ochlerotatus camptorhynchus TaxID=644619 RepID=UPI0031D7DA8F
MNNSRNETTLLSFSFFERVLPHRHVSTPIHARSDPRMELKKLINPLDLSVASTLTADETPLDLSIGPHTRADSTKVIDLALPRKSEETKKETMSPVIPLNLRTANFNQHDRQTESLGLDNLHDTFWRTSVQKRAVILHANAYTNPKVNLDNTGKGEASPSISLTADQHRNDSVGAHHADLLQDPEDEPNEQEGDPTLLNELSIYEYFEEYQNIDSDHSSDDSDAGFVEDSRRNHQLPVAGHSQIEQDTKSAFNVSGAEALELEFQERQEKKANIRKYNKTQKEKATCPQQAAIQRRLPMGS